MKPVGLLMKVGFLGALLLAAVTSRAYAQGDADWIFNQTKPEKVISRGGNVDDLQDVESPWNVSGAAPESTPTAAPTPKPRKQPLSMQNSIGGFYDTLNDTNGSQSALDAITNPNTILHTTLSLAEPGVEAGHTNAMLLAQQSLTNRYLAQQALAQQFAMIPETGDARRAYYGCIDKKIKSGYRWLQAQSECMGDYAEEIDSGGDELVTGSEGGQFDMEDNPNHVTNTDIPADLTGASGAEKGDRITDLMFATSESSTKSTEQQNIIATYKAIVGDAVIVIEKDGGRSTVRYNDVDPTTTGRSKYEDIRKTIYGKLIDLLKERCKYIWSGTTTASTYKPFEDLKNFWTSSDTAGTIDPILKELSLPDFQMKPAVADVIYFNYMGKRISGAPACDTEFADSKVGYDILKGSDLTKVTMELRDLWFVASSIATLRLLRVYIYLYDWVSNSGLDGENLEHARALIWKQISGQQTDAGRVQERYERTLNLLRQKIEKMHEAVSAMAGGATALRGTYRDKNKTYVPNPWMSGAGAEASVE